MPATSVISPSSAGELSMLKIRGARTHNLKNVDLDIPHQAITVLTGVSGSGKSSLAFDTIFAEGQRQYIDSLSAYARRFFQQLPRPPVESMTGLQPTLCIDQKQASANPRSTVGTVTEVYDYLRLLMARLGTPHCYRCGTPIEQQSPERIIGELSRLPEGTRIVLLAPMVRGRKGGHADVLEAIRRAGLVRARIDGVDRELDDAPKLAVRQNHTIEAVVDRFVARADNLTRLADAVRLALRLADGLVTARTLDPQRREQADVPEAWTERLFSTKYACPACGAAFAEVEPRIFSFNSPQGACPSCDGTGAATSAAETEPDAERIPCSSCGGRRLKDEALSVLLAGLNIAQACELPLSQVLAWLDRVGEGGSFIEANARAKSLSDDDVAVFTPIAREIRSRVQFLDQVGLGYLTLARAAETLSGGELQRVRLATSIGSGLIGVCYVLDEPSVGLHAADNAALIAAIQRLRQQGNTLIIVEHDEAMMMAADLLVDMGPAAGAGGGHVIVADTPPRVKKHRESLTGQYLAGKKSIPVPKTLRSVDPEKSIRVHGASRHNLRSVDVEFPLEVFAAVTGVSGSGKSTLVHDILRPCLASAAAGRGPDVRHAQSIDGWELIDKVIDIDQNSIGRSSRSTPATYSGVWDEIRKVFANSRDAKTRGFAPSRFSFNSGAGRCEACAGAGEQRLEMNFLADVFVQCPVCNGKRFNRATLSVRYRHKSIAEVLAMSIDEATEFFENFPKVQRLLRPLQAVGLGYLHLGQPSTTLSGGESQRIKLAGELARPATGRTFYILDEPTTGLHVDDVRRLIDVLQGLVDRGNSVLVIEHHLDVVKVADWVIDLGPGGGEDGGRIVATGTPRHIADCPESLTGRFLKELL